MKIGFFGAGKMAEGILQAIPDKKSVVMAEKVSARAKELKKRYGVAVTDSVAEVAKAADLIFLAVRPQDVDAVAGEAKPFLTAKKTLVSIVAGKTCAKLRSAFGTKPGLVRVMPNLALRAGAGMCAICGEGEGERGERNGEKGERGENGEKGERGNPPSLKLRRTGRLRDVERILGGAGATVRLEEKDFDAVTALSGSGPAYFAYMEQAMAEGGVALGLKPAVARLLAEQTMYGTAKFLRESGMDLEQFIAGVCTKGGTTAAGMAKLAKPCFKKTVAATLAAAAKRSRELA